MTTGESSTGHPPTPGAKPTSHDVARAAGVSQAAVSLVLSGKWRGRVSEPTAQRVRTAARDLGYRPNLAARSLRLGETRTALLVVPALTSEFFTRVHTGAARVAARHTFGVVLYPAPPGDQHDRATPTAPAPLISDPFASAPAAIDGIIASSMAAHALTAIRGDRLPLVMLDSDPAGEPGAVTVNPDIADGMRQVTRHLLALGHRRFLHLAAAVDSWTFQIRARTLASALTGTGAELHTAHTPLTIDDARATTHTALTTPTTAPRPTAIVCDDDVLAVGACKAARRLGLHIPRDLSVTGFDDLTLATAVEPELTTIRLPGEGVGEHGMTALLGLLDGRKPTPDTLPVRLITRASTGPPPHGN